MGILSFLKLGSKQASLAADAAIKKELFDAILQNHFTDFEMLCQKHEQSIFEYFAQWKLSAADLRADKDVYELEIRCLQIVANYFKREQKRDELTAIFTGYDDSPETKKWRDQVAIAQNLMREMRFAEALPILQESLKEGDEVPSFGASSLRPITLGSIGECYFQLGQAQNAIEPMKEALALAEAQRDSEAIFQYVRSLYEIHRYLGDSATASTYAMHFSQALENCGELISASNWRHQSRSIVNGESAFRIVLRIGEELFELDDIPVVQTQTVEFLPMRNRTELAPSSALCEAGRELAEKGDVDEALKKFSLAIELDPFNHFPHYYSAAIYMHKGEFSRAVESYEKCEKLCPGWENSRAELWLARMLNQGRMQADAYQAAVAFGNEALPADERQKICQDMVRKYPDYAECFYRLGKIEALAGRFEAAKENLKQGLVKADDPDVKSRLLVDLALLTSDKQEKISAFQACLQTDNSNPIAKATAAYCLRQLEGEA